ncbi:hypothetical protein E0500_028300 [Streptomyces sp. KM273126]|uniref:hypothetical protein n=1 Tax=Streptomyces sp. KM273126 TaxID=2545247 RepID=UPI0015EB69D6|nr:hypothetical protein [Streptomyces sp. KM273126]MBA2811199.1 hypothetical protein [Streptomyces sp. KM273126]
MIEEFDGDQPTHQRWALARRSVTRPDEIAYYLGYAPVGTDVDRLMRVAERRWAIEECFQAAKYECGLDQYEVRRYVGWMRHVTLAMLAHAFLAATAPRRPLGNSPSTPHPPTTSHPHSELVAMAAQAPSRRPPLPLPAASPLVGWGSGKTALTRHQPTTLRRWL